MEARVSHRNQWCRNLLWKIAQRQFASKLVVSRGVDDSHNEDQNTPVRVAVPYVTDSGQLRDVTLSEYHIGVWRDYCYICPACVVERKIGMFMCCRFAFCLHWQRLLSD